MDSLTTITEKLQIDPLIAKLLVKRGMADPSSALRFLSPSLKDLHDPFLLDGMDLAVARIHQAIEQKERILVYGDYDADGVSSTALMLQILYELEADVDYYIPDRFAEGYGINKKAIRLAKEQGFQLMISVDTGITAVEETGLANELGLDLIITDHHEPPERLPEAYAILNPKKKNDTYPFPMLAGVGVAFKLATALLGRLPEEWLDIVALGTIADLVPLVGENRILAFYGLEKMRSRNHVGLAALMEVAGIDQDISAGHVGFFLGPRINAGGRLATAHQAVELLITSHTKEAKEIATKLDQLNRERQDLVEQIVEEAKVQIESDPQRHQSVIVVASEGWHEGVIGIVASRLVEVYYRPTLVLSIDAEKGIAKGSARSIASFDIYQALQKSSDFLSQYGGHTMAAGMTLLLDQLRPFHESLSRLAKEWLTADDYIPQTAVEGRLTLHQIDLPFIEQIEQLAPYGVGNPTPVFEIDGSHIQRIQMLGQDHQHLKLIVHQEEQKMEALKFRCEGLAEQLTPSASVDMVVELSVNEWNRKRKPQLMIKDLRISHPQVFDWRSNRKERRSQSLIAPSFLWIVSESNREIVPALQPHLEWEQIDRWEEGVYKACPNIVFYDPPPSLACYRHGLQCLSHAERFYFLFGDMDLKETLVSFPQRDQFKHLYQTLHQNRPSRLSLQRHVSSLSRRLGISKACLLFMIQVFEELGFMEREGEYVQLLSQPMKQGLQNSKRYQEQLAQNEVLHHLIYASYQDLCEQIGKHGYACSSSKETQLEAGFS